MIDRRPSSRRSASYGLTSGTTIVVPRCRIALASRSARAWLSAKLTRARLARLTTLRLTTTAPTIDVTPRTCLPLIPNRIGTGGLRDRRLLGLLGPQPQLIQLVMQGLQADAENFGGASLVVARVLQRHHDQPPLRFFDRDPGRERHLRLMRRRRLFRQRRRQV